ncbi:MAG: MFS transporter, partial [Clostridiales bacterium]|nr:MFS transporter [Clostridiales bacterium]
MREARPKLKGELSNKTILMYAMSTIGRDMAYALFTGYLMSFILFTKSLTTEQFAAVGVVFIACRVFDAVIDPIIGGLIENTRSRWGKFKPWIFVGMALCAGVILLTFVLPIQGWAFVGFIAAMYLLFSATYSLNDIAYWGMLPALTSDQSDRNKLTSFVSICTGIGGFFINTFVPILTVGATVIGGNA